MTGTWHWLNSGMGTDANFITILNPPTIPVSKCSTFLGTSKSCVPIVTTWHTRLLLFVTFIQETLNKNAYDIWFFRYIYGVSILAFCLHWRIFEGSNRKRQSRLQ